MVVDDGADLAVGGEMADGDARKTAVDLEALDEDALADELEAGDFLEDAVVRGLVERDGVHGLVLDLALGPLLFLRCLPSPAAHCCFRFGLCWAFVSALAQSLHPSLGRCIHPAAARQRPENTTAELAEAPAAIAQALAGPDRTDTHHVQGRSSSSVSKSEFALVRTSNYGVDRSVVFDPCASFCLAAWACVPSTVIGEAPLQYFLVVL